MPSGGVKITDKMQNETKKKGWNIILSVSLKKKQLKNILKNMKKTNMKFMKCSI